MRYNENQHGESGAVATYGTKESDRGRSNTVHDGPYWANQLACARKNTEKWHKQCKEIIKEYVDERSYDDDVHKFNLFHANTTLLSNSLYSKIPHPEVTRRFADYDDDVARVAALIVERALFNELENRDDFDESARNSILDRLLCGLATMWVRYDGQFTTTTDEFGNETEVTTDEHAALEYVNYNDFLWGPARGWREVPWVARAVYLTDEQLMSRFGETAKRANGSSYGQDESASDTYGEQKAGGSKKCRIYEIWCKETKYVYWVSENGVLLDSKADFLHLPGFFPCPKPLLSTCSTTKLLPVPDYYIVQDLYIELNKINNRIYNLYNVIRAAGVYDEEQTALIDLLSNGDTNIMVPVKDWAMLKELGGISGATSWLDIRPYIDAIRELFAARESTKSQIFEMTGLSDIVRGATKATETATAQQIKSQFASIRLNALQNDVARFFSDAIALKARVMCRFYQPERLVSLAGALSEPDQQLIPAALALLSDNGGDLRIKVSVDSLQLPNWEVDKAEKTEFIASFSNLLRESIPAIESVPELGEGLLALIRWGITGYRGTQEIEGVLDAALAGATQQRNKQTNEPSPQQLLDQQRLQVEQKKNEIELQRLVLENKKIELQIAQLQVEHNVKMTKLATDKQLKTTRQAIEVSKFTTQQQADAQQRADDHAASVLDAGVKVAKIASQGGHHANLPSAM